MMTATEQALFTVQETAKFLRLGVSTVWRHTQRGTMPKPIKLGGASRWRKADLDNYIDAAAMEGALASANVAATANMETRP